MQTLNLSLAQDRTTYFQQSIFNNLNYWLAWAQAHLDQLPKLELERNNIIRAIHFGLNLGQLAWPLTSQLITQLSPHMERRGEWSQWQPIIQRGLALAEQQNDSAKQAVLTCILARLHHLQSRMDEAILQYRRTMRLARAAGDVYNEARACTNLGYLYIDRGRWRRAEVLCYHALQRFTEIDSGYGRAHTENHLGLLYTKRADWDLARLHLERARAIWQANDDRFGLMRANINLGNLYVDMGKPDLALRHLTRASKQATEQNDNIEMATICLNMGIAYRLKGKPKQAERYAHQAKSLYERYFILPGAARAAHNLAMAHLDQKNWSTAKRCLESARQIWQNLADNLEQMKAVIGFLELALAQGDHPQVVACWQELEDYKARYGSGHFPPYLYSLLNKYRHSLPDEASLQAAADILSTNLTRP